LLISVVKDYRKYPFLRRAIRYIIKERIMFDLVVLVYTQGCVRVADIEETVQAIWSG